MHTATVTVISIALAIGAGFVTYGSMPAEPHPAPNPDHTKEPALQLLVKIGEQAITMTAGETAQLSGTFTDPSVRVTVAPHRVFAYDTLTFNYPSAYVFEYEEERGNYKIWTLSGNDLTMMLFAFSMPVSDEEFTQSIVDQFGEENCKMSDAAPIQLGDSEVKGSSIDVQIVGAHLKANIYRVQASQSETLFLHLQDSLDPGETQTAEYKAAAEMLAKTWKVTEQD